MTDRLDELWALQEEQQRLWYNAATMSAADRSDVSMELLLNAHKQLVDLQRVVVDHYHLLKREHAPTPSAIVSPAADLAKILISLLQLGGVDAELFVMEFIRKTEVVKRKWAFEQDQLAGTKILLCDIDGCIGRWVDAFCAYLDALGVAYDRTNLNAPDLEVHKAAFHDTGCFADLPHDEDAVLVLNGWRAVEKSKRRLILVTARPYRQYKRIYSDTLAWTKRIWLECDHILFESDKAEAVRQVQPARIIAHIEDRGRHALEVANAGVKVLKLPNEGAGSNEDVRHPNIIPVAGWAEIRDHLETLTRS